MKNKCIKIACNSKNSVKFVTLRKNILTNAGQRLAFCLRAFFMPVSFVELRYRYLCTPVPAVNAPEAFVSNLLSSGKGAGIFCFIFYANITHFSTCRPKWRMRSVRARNAQEESQPLRNESRPARNHLLFLPMLSGNKNYENKRFRTYFHCPSSGGEIHDTYRSMFYRKAENKIRTFVFC